VSVENILEMRSVVKQFPGVRALDNVELELRKGEVLALVGENGAGKSTLMRVLLGIYRPTSGSITFKGQPFAPMSPMDALRSGISMIHQEITLVPTMTVAENIWLGREDKFSSCGFLNTKKRERAAQELLARFDLDIQSHALVSSLSVANMQLVEIIRAISYSSDVIIMDEPTSALAQNEVEILFRIIRRLKAEQISVIFISHKLDEVFGICDRIMVLRYGRFITAVNSSELDEARLIPYIVGREVTNLFPKLKAEIADGVLEVRGLGKRGVFKDISFYVRKGEILGFAGLMGAGRSEIASALFGIDPYDEGEIFIRGKKVRIRSCTDAIMNGIGMVTEDRLRRGVIHKLSVKFNITIANLRRYTDRLGFVHGKAEAEDVETKIRQINIKVSNPKQAIATLSGGNQQKCIIAKWLLTDPDILILDEPTRGIDVGSKAEIHRMISQLAQSGKAIIMISSELPEVMGMSDRMMVVCRGRITAEFSRQEFDSERIMRSAFGLEN